MPAAPTILITGATGFLGRQVCAAAVKKGFHTVGTSFSRSSPGQVYDLVKLDLNDNGALEATLDQVKPVAVIHCAAARFPDDVDKNPNGARRLNVEASRSLACACAEREILLVYLSTDYVFDGKEEDAHLRPYGPNSTTCPANLYGQTKLDGERVILEHTAQSGRGYVLRVPVLYGPAEKPSESSVNVLLDTIQKADTGIITADDYSIRYPTCTVEVGRILAEMLNKLLEMHAVGSASSVGRCRVFGFTGEEGMTKFEMCRRLAKLTGGVVDNIRPEVKGTAGRPFDCHLDTSGLKELGVDIHHVGFDEWWGRVLASSPTL